MRSAALPLCRPILHRTLAALGLVLLMAGAAANDSQPVRIIFDTDMAEDIDDVGALAVLHHLADRGEVELLACMVSSNNPHAAPCIDALNTWYGRPDIPIGTASRFRQRADVDHAKQVTSRYTQQLAEEFPQDLTTTQGGVDAVKLYRKLLANEQQRLTIVTVGFLGNIAALVESPADEISPLTGRKLVEQKVTRWVLMGGIFPEGKFPNGAGEYNLSFGTDDVRIAIEQWPGEILFSGFEIGQPIGTGAGLTELPAEHPARRGFTLFNRLTDRSSWDQTAVLVAARGPGEYWTLSEPGYCQVPAGSTGQVEWVSDPAGRHRYLVQKMPIDQLAELIEEMMMAAPTARH